PNPPTPMMKTSSKLFVAALISAIVKQRHRWAGKDSDPSYFVFDDLSSMVSRNLFLSQKTAMPTTVASIRLKIAIATTIAMEILDFFVDWVENP
ncbi:hypothetical protein A2U01_0043245, partial [Trifolium medium]|nr:hypothetical protein [Trifolium medium]